MSVDHPLPDLEEQGGARPKGGQLPKASDPLRRTTHHKGLHTGEKSRNRAERGEKKGGRKEERGRRRAQPPNPSCWEEFLIDARLGTDDRGLRRLNVGRLWLTVGGIGFAVRDGFLSNIG
ncbi:hypothetical protein RHSIM_Rhsim10G0105400 [Rhododendron simsii]|uniref:Uncharacterized protein n=1 Tax=Rhododendron simsii TaxID=118357 RepID=A0A834G9M7_RHOSS|nr:hypothetical protein RHSIM_Rhsim10G0105400 [Rhododendron simsii]